VTIAHSKTPELAALCATADILVSAIGRPGFVTPAFVNPGATVIDVGISRLTDETVARQLFEGSPRLADFARRGSLVVGDVHPGVASTAGALTPVPGGVGPLTIAMLLKNTLTAARARHSAL
jgi:methylenetetrahydrofolate dehydrogenase (NADP+)/methenyltetrahydrofolate cyclohydrolase